MGAKSVFNELFKTFQNSDFFKDALYDFSWVEVTSFGIDRVTGDQITTEETYSAKAFLISPSRSDRPAESMFKEYQIGDIVVNVRQAELLVRPPLNQEVTFNGRNFICKEVVADPVGVSWQMLLRS